MLCEKRIYIFFFLSHCTWMCRGYVVIIMKIFIFLSLVSARELQGCFESSDNGLKCFKCFAFCDLWSTSRDQDQAYISVK